MCTGVELAFAAQAIATVATTAGAGYSIYSGQQAAAASQKAEKLRERQMDMERTQRQRAAIRDFQLKRATAASNNVSSTGTLQNSAFQGASSAYSSSLGVNLGEVDRSADIGKGIFRANADYSQASANAQAGSQVSGFGKDLFASGPEIGRIGSTLFNGA